MENRSKNVIHEVSDNDTVVSENEHLMRVKLVVIAVLGVGRIVFFSC